MFYNNRFLKDLETIFDVFDTSQQRYQSDNVRRYFKEGALHREDGPAVVYLDKSKKDEYWLEGAKVSKKEVEAFKEEKELKKTHVVYLRHGQPHKVSGKQLKEIEALLNLD